MQRGLRPAVALAVALTTLVLSASSGLGYVWCAPMQQARTHCCCPTPTAEERATDRFQVSCCERRELGAMPSGTSGALAHHVIVAAPCTGVVSLEVAFAAPTLAIDAPRTSEHEARAGPGQRTHARHSVYLI